MRPWPSRRAVYLVFYVDDETLAEAVSSVHDSEESAKAVAKEDDRIQRWSVWTMEEEEWL